jgi:hypothetical protein
MAFLFFAISVTSPVMAASGTMAREIRVALPPTTKSVIGAMFLSAEVSLGVDRFCHGVGTDFEDDTIGEYLSGFLEELNDPDGHNYVQVEIIEGTQAASNGTQTTENGWTSRVWFGKSQGEEVWRWGVEFFIRARDGVVDSTSYRCVGAG